VPYTTYRLSEPYRIVVDLGAVDFALPPTAGRQGRGLVSAFRYGLISPGRSRIVIDTPGPVRVAAARLERSPTGPGVRLELDLTPTTATELAAEEMAAAARTIDVRKPEPEPPPERRKAPLRARPVIVIDPGHGGIDTGALGALGLEKNLVLAVALEIRRALVAARRFEVIMTRSSDAFVSLDQRVRISRRHAADLFLSIHADSLAIREHAQSVRGATVYVLSEKASDDRAQRMAEKENAADLLAGLQVDRSPGNEQVRDILLDLMRRESATLSSDFRTLLLGHMRPRLALAKEPARAAPFKVLRQPGSPSLLIELGYLSNAEDARLMASQAWQRTFGETVAAAVGEYFRTRVARRQP
jgi:N-acetylmuramoyl-L-alanine amidase